METTIDVQTCLAQAIRSALAGQEASNPQVESLYAKWRDMSLTQRSALVQLQNWASDSSLRSEFVPHAQFSQRRMHQLLDVLEA